MGPMSMPPQPMTTMPRRPMTSLEQVPTEEEQARTSPHAGHADDLANAEGANGVIPADLNDGLGQSGHVAPDGEQPRYVSWVVPTLLVGASWVISMVVFASVIFDGHEPYHVTVYEWIGAGDFHVEIAFLVDSLTAMLLLVVSSVGLLVHVYSIGYMHGDRGFWRFFAYLNLFMVSMLLLILADNFLLLYVGWELVGLCSYLLIGFWYKKPSAAGAAKKAFIVNRIGDFGFGLGIMAIWTFLGTLQFEEVFAQIGTLEPAVITLIALLLFAGAVGKSAQFPLHVWLPDAMEGPTPVSALIHAATMVNAGVYMVARANPIFAESPTAMWVVAGIGVFTAILAAAIALTQNDIKKVLAYSTMSQLAYMFFALGIGAWVAAIFHLVSHGFFKGLLFMGSGSVIHGAAGEQDMRFLGGLRERMRWTYWTMVIGSLALAGIPILAGFFSKDEILAEAFNRGYYLFYAVGVVVAFMTAFYTFRMIYMTFHGAWRGPREAWHHVHESAPTMVAPLVVLAVPTVAGRAAAGHPAGGRPDPRLAGGGLRARRGGDAGILPGSIAAGEHHGFSLFGLGGLLLLIGASGGRGGHLARATAGTSRAAGGAARDSWSASRWASAPGMYAASLNKYYFDDFYHLVFARGGVLVANACGGSTPRSSTARSTGPAGSPSDSAAPCAASRPAAPRTTALGIATGLVLVLVAYLVIRAMTDLAATCRSSAWSSSRRSIGVLVAAAGAGRPAIGPSAGSRCWRRSSAWASACCLLGYEPGGAGVPVPRGHWMDPGLRDAATGWASTACRWCWSSSPPCSAWSRILYSWDPIQTRVKEYYATMLLLMVGMLGVFVSLDLFLFYVFWELSLIPMYLVIGIWGGPRRIYATVKFVIYTLVGSLLMLVAILAVAIAHRRGRQRVHLRLRAAARLPLHRWRSRRWPSSPSSWPSPSRCRCGRCTPGCPMRTSRRPPPAPSSWPACCSSWAATASCASACRCCPDAAVEFAPIVIGLAVIAILYGALVSMVQPDLKKLIAYSSVSHMGFVMLGAFVFNDPGAAGRRLPDDQPRRHHRRPLPAGGRHLRAHPRPPDRAHGRPQRAAAALRGDLRALHLRQHRAARPVGLHRRVPGAAGRLPVQRLGGRRPRCWWSSSARSTCCGCSSASSSPSRPAGCGAGGRR